MLQHDDLEVVGPAVPQSGAGRAHPRRVAPDDDDPTGHRWHRRVDAVIWKTSDSVRSWRTQPRAVDPVEVDGRVVRLTNPDRVYFSARGETKLDLAHYYLSVGHGIVNALRDRPCMLHRFPTGVDGEKVHQKRLPKGAPGLGRDGAGALPALQPHRRRAVRHRSSRT